MTNNSKKKRRHILKPSRLIFLIVLLAANTFAWFIYATRINTDVSVHVRAWNIIFESGDNQIANEVDINVNSVYPGMEDYDYEIKAYNRSEVNATLTYQILSARILDQEYTSVEQKNDLGLPVLEDDLTSAQLETKLANDYPFSITIATSSETIQLGSGVETYTLSVTWPYENDNDEADTLWGINAYQYKESNPGNPSIALKIRIIITQNAS